MAYLWLLSEAFQTGARSERVLVRQIFGWNSSLRGDWIRKLRWLHNRGGKLGRAEEGTARIRNRASNGLSYEAYLRISPMFVPTRWNRGLLPDVSLEGITHLADEHVLDRQSFVAGLVALPECVRCGGTTECIERVFYQCPVVRSILYEQLFILDSSSVCSNMRSIWDREQNFLLALIWMVVWMMKLKEVHEILSLSSHHLDAFFKYQPKFRLERKRLSSEVIAERWKTVARFVRVNGSNLK